MPRKKSDENLTKVISSIISPEDFGILEEYAKLFYNGNVLEVNDFTLGTVRLSNWVKDMRRRD